MICLITVKIAKSMEKTLAGMIPNVAALKRSLILVYGLVRFVKTSQWSVIMISNIFLALKKSNLLEGIRYENARKFDVNKMYEAGLHDTHIETALKRILSDFE